MIKTRQRKPTDPAYSRAYYVANRTACLANSIAWAKKNPEKAKLNLKKAYYKRKYGITIAHRDALFNAQARRCAVCDTGSPNSKAGWHVDHNHTTGAVRGILCQRCNIALGYLENEPQMARLQKYLEKHQ